jgi:ABC-type hemin transport system substrate-binding protein
VQNGQHSRRPTIQALDWLTEPDCAYSNDRKSDPAVNQDNANRYPNRIVCLTEETTEALYLLGEDSRIVGISGFTVRPPRARKEKPRVSAFTSARIERIVELRPDLVLGFSDLQADIAADLVRRGIEVHVFNQRSVRNPARNPHAGRHDRRRGGDSAGW